MFGSEKILFGSDYPFSSPAYELEKVLRLNLTKEQAWAVLGDNFRRLCRLDYPARNLPLPPESR
jgi:predicted TIM-barrel fold metal-dependent hydrolase